ncbi:nucleotidyl transferase AbiEii/AbiGii toxin family protein [Bremerella sp. P1]|uniref:nucleotidyl transferase AbiEii/AbiGii toxin family protein n=1 Tax=Bremerella sp. P1 TaxID=3026424 RepID=UPI002367A4B6|nr:nucleotidyl transferase AbiEii/AbiGii toxin family protein [Bremerella sp. P1]WDI44389.1 nucleotidyl transferase AbiEii/AbiGii toxin family protein [Bremerella sp. P1]
MNFQPSQTYETHLTLASNRSDGIESARTWATAAGLKWTEIELSRGDHQRQPMITYWGTDSLESQHATAKQIEEQLQPLGLQVVRLKTDCYGQGKDLYDAVLLADHTTLDAELLRQTFEVSDTWTAHCPNPVDRFDADAILNWHIEWEDFKKEYPQIPGTQEEWKYRLITGLDSLLTQLLQ